MKKTIFDMTDEEYNEMCERWWKSPEGQKTLEKINHDIKNSYATFQEEKKKHRIRKFFKRLFCDHEWSDGSNLPGQQSFICSKCGKEFWWYPEE